MTKKLTLAFLALLCYSSLMNAQTVSDENAYNASQQQATTNGTSDLTANGNIKLYPQPAKETLRVDLGRIPEQSVRYRVHAITEQFIVEDNTKSQIFDIDVSNWPAGIYILQIYNKNGQILRKFVVSGQ